MNLRDDLGVENIQIKLSHSDAVKLNIQVKKK